MRKEQIPKPDVQPDDKWITKSGVLFTIKEVCDHYVKVQVNNNGNIHEGTFSRLYARLSLDGSTEKYLQG